MPHVIKPWHCFLKCCLSTDLKKETTFSFWTNKIKSDLFLEFAFRHGRFLKQLRRTNFNSDDSFHAWCLLPISVTNADVRWHVSVYILKFFIPIQINLTYSDSKSTRIYHIVKFMPANEKSLEDLFCYFGSLNNLVINVFYFLKLNSNWSGKKRWFGRA